MKRRQFGLLVMALVAGVTALTSLPAKANLAITPTLVVIEGRQRYADLNIVNVTNQRKTYEINWKYLRMEEGSGVYKPSERSTTSFDLPSNVVFTPRRVTVQPKGAQRIRFALRLKGEPPAPGDYRAHVQLSDKPNPSPTEGDILEENQAEVSLSMNLGFSIPVVYRVGDVNGGEATIGNVTAEINPKTNKIEAVIPIKRKEGPYGVMGSLLVNYKGETVGQVGNANIFPEINERVFRVPLNIQSLSGGSLEVVYRDYNKEKGVTFDKRSIKIAD